VIASGHRAFTITNHEFIEMLRLRMSLDREIAAR